MEPTANDHTRRNIKLAMPYLLNSRIGYAAQHVPHSMFWSVLWSLHRENEKPMSHKDSEGCEVQPSQRLRLARTVANLALLCCLAHSSPLDLSHVPAREQHRKATKSSFTEYSRHSQYIHVRLATSMGTWY